MKLVSEVSRTMMHNILPSKPTICSHVSTPWGITALPEPVLSIEKKCGYCDGIGHYTPMVDPKESDARTWLCANPVCEVYKAVTGPRPTTPATSKKRSLEWPLFCELNGIGDEHHDVKFESIDQAQAKISYLLKFSTTPRGIILMRGEPGTGKSYCCLAACEFFTRNNTSAMFTTQKNLANKWLDTFKINDNYNNFIDKVTTFNLLVIDDFGTGELPPGFMGFFMELINTRMQWKTRGTIITTNLEEKPFNQFCGEALSDRLLTAQIFEFKGKTRRKKTIL